MNTKIKLIYSLSLLLPTNMAKAVANDKLLASEYCKFSRRIRICDKNRWRKIVKLVAKELINEC